MAAPKKKTLAEGPWTMKKAEVDTFARVTESNRKQAVVIGRILYIISKEGNVYTYGGCMTIDPCLLKGWWKWPWLPFVNQRTSHFRVFIESDMSRDDWAADYKALLDMHIEKEQLYIKREDPILTYIKE